MKHINRRLESLLCSFNPSPSGELEGGRRERIYNGFTTALERSCRLPSGSLPTGEGGGRGRGPFCFLMQNY